MTDPDQIWHRLVEAARQTPVAQSEEMPFGFDTRLLAGLRGRWNQPMPWRALLRGALACSTLIMLLALLASFRSSSQDDVNELAAAESVIALSLSDSQ